MFSLYMLGAGIDTDYLSIIMVWVGYGRYFFILVLVFSFLKKNDDVRLWTAIIGIEYVLHLIMVYVFCLRFTRGSFMLFMDLAVYIFIYVTCPAVTAWLIGRISRRIRNDILAVTVLFILGSVFLFNIVQEVLLFPVFRLSDNAYTVISKAFIIFNNSLRNAFAVSNRFAPFTVTITDVATALFWIGVFALVLGMVSRRKKMAVLIVPVLCCAFLMTLKENKYQVYENRSFSDNGKKMLDSWNVDQVYYGSRNIILRDSEPVRAETEFSIESYHLRIKAGLKTKFTAVLQLSEADVDEYVFSLYHGYVVRSITDKEGNALVFSQQDDWITVFPEEKALREITMEYEGIGMTYMAAKEYICLPEYYIYYPIAGKYTVYNFRTMNYAKNIDLPETYFSIVVDAGYEVYSNIPKKDYNVFEGAASGPVLLGGKYLDACEDNGVTIVYSTFNVDEKTAKEQYEDMISFYQAQNVDLSGKSWFDCPYYGGTYERFYVADEYIFGNYNELMLNMPLTYDIPTSEVLKWRK
ncbi:MAG: hypothetical protein NC086_06405 [Alistipes sp.]|nr:hypothetical protein [Alistipes sp.]